MLAKLAIFCAVILTRVSDAAEEVEDVPSPLRYRISKNVLKRMFALRDQQLFKVVTDVQVDQDLVHFQTFNFTLAPKGSLEDFDFDLHLTREYFGAESDQVVMSGAGTLIDGS